MTPEALWAMGRIGSVVRNSETGLLAYTVSYYSVEENRSSTWIRICQHGDELKVLVSGFFMLVGKNSTSYMCTNITGHAEPQVHRIFNVCGTFSPVYERGRTKS